MRRNSQTRWPKFAADPDRRQGRHLPLEDPKTLCHNAPSGRPYHEIRAMSRSRISLRAPGARPSQRSEHFVWQGHQHIRAALQFRQMRSRLRQDALVEEPRQSELAVELCIARSNGLPRKHSLDDLVPHVAERRQAEEVQVFGRRGPDLVRIGLGALCNPDRRLLKLSKRALQRSKVFRERWVTLAVLYEITHLGQERLHRASTILAELSPDQIERLDAVRAFIDHRDARIADELLHPPFADEAVPP